MVSFSLKSFFHISSLDVFLRQHLLEIICLLDCWCPSRRCLRHSGERASVHNNIWLTSIFSRWHLQYDINLINNWHWRTLYKKWVLWSKNGAENPVNDGILAIFTSTWPCKRCQKIAVLYFRLRRPAGCHQWQL